MQHTFFSQVTSISLTEARPVDGRVNSFCRDLIIGDENGLHYLSLHAVSAEALTLPAEAALTKSREEEYAAVCAERADAMAVGRVLGFPGGYVPRGDCEAEMDAYERWHLAGGHLDAAPERAELATVEF